MRLSDIPDNRNREKHHTEVGVGGVANCRIGPGALLRPGLSDTSDAVF